MALNMYMCLCVALSLSPAINGGFMVGGYTNRDPNDAAITDAAKFSVQAYNEESNDVHFFKLGEIVSAQSQVVAGINYKLIVEIGKTPCRKNHASDMHACDGDNTEVLQVLSCTFVVFQSLPPQSYSLTKHDCKPK
ncbi:cystatin-2-like [Hyla sarda]|uniref:cystatin-2-like n=1 Tax=Hyla sarda TaxID=327740 RepID=UPI0024C2F659|nr:cystatin-2-like [Hyla sarda]XP_056423589.1 cystatin-2-like [Hyla sarda]